MKRLENIKLNVKNKILLILFLGVSSLVFMAVSCEQPEKIGVLFVTHGGFATFKDQHVFDVGLQQFSYDTNHPASDTINSSSRWPLVMIQPETKKYRIKYQEFYERQGGSDVFIDIADSLTAVIQSELNGLGLLNGISFIVEQVNWMSGEDISRYPYPRYMYYPQDGEGDNLTYCGEKEPDGPWEGCDPERYNVDGPAEKLLKQGVSSIIMIDMTTGGVRFAKTFDAYKLTKMSIDNWNEEYGTDVSLLWVNDYTDFMLRAYPTKPENWSGFIGEPEEYAAPPWAADQNPVANDPELAAFHVDGIIKRFSPDVDPKDTGIMIMNHAIRDYNEYFDPKTDDTLVINKNIKKQLLEMFPEMDPDNIIGSFMGIREVNPEAEHTEKERTRKMRGESLGHGWLYLGEKKLPGGEWGYRYWDALEYLKNRGVKHIVVGFSQVVQASNMDLMELPNQIGKEIGTSTWLFWDNPDYDNYPGVGHPFLDYYGNWVDTECDGAPCCFTMGGCPDGRPYPPPRQTELRFIRGDFDPSLAYDLSDYGHLGYDETGASGPPDPNMPVQDQYTGTWAIYAPPNDDTDFAKFIANHVLDAALGKLQ